MQKKNYFCNPVRFLRCMKLAGSSIIIINPLRKEKVFSMIIVPVKEGENIERALKKLKRKFEKTGVVRELRNRQKFTKPSVVARERRLKAIYIQQLQTKAENNAM